MEPYTLNPMVPNVEPLKGTLMVPLKEPLEYMDPKGTNNAWLQRSAGAKAQILSSCAVGEGLGFRDEGLGLGVYGLGCVWLTVNGLGFVGYIGFAVSGLGFRV